MSASRAEGTRNTRHIAQHPNCIYCGGIDAGTQVDHVPPIAVYTLRRRPEGLEFTTCGPCHQGTRKLDAVAAFYSRLYPDPKTEDAQRELERLYTGMTKAVPEIGEEIRRNAYRTAAFDDHALMTAALGKGQPLNIFGAVARRYFDAFAARVGLALHYHATGKALQAKGTIFVRSFTNTALTNGALPEGMLESMGDFTALMQKGTDAHNDFAFLSNLGRDDSETMIFFRLRHSMGAAVFCFSHAPSDGGMGLTAFKPGFLKTPNKL